jgi:hypothetical protein
MLRHVTFIHARARKAAWKCTRYASLMVEKRTAPARGSTSRVGKGERFLLPASVFGAFARRSVDDWRRDHGCHAWYSGIAGRTISSMRPERILLALVWLMLAAAFVAWAIGGAASLRSTSIWLWLAATGVLGLPLLLWLVDVIVRAVRR